MFFTNVALSLFLAHSFAVSATAVLESRATCPLTEVNAYRYGCDQTGWVQTPSYLKILKDVSRLQDCAKSCYSNTACKSFRFVKTERKCYLYNKYLDAMAFTDDNFENGVFYERECFTTDCNTIKACEAIDQCPNEFGYTYFYYYYTDFGCGYGVTAKLKGGSPKQTTLKKGLKTCQAASACADKAPQGPFVISYHKPSKRWLCTLFDFLKPYDSTPTLHEQHINSMTLTAKNSSIGASFGYWIYDEYYPDGS